jgi:Xaa-Pro aminopeptidase
MRQRNVGALYLEDSMFKRYVLNTKVPGSAVFVPVEGEALAIVRRRDIGYVGAQHPNVRLPFESRGGAHSESGDANESGDGAAIGDGVADLMREYGLEGEQVAVDLLGPVAYFGLTRAEIALVDAAPIFEKTWSVKTDDELEIYRAIGHQYEHAMTAFRDALRPGITENQLAAVITSAWYEADGEDIAQLNVCVAENMNPWKRWPTQRAANDGDFAGVDLHGRGFNGLRGDASRTFFVGEHPTAAHRDLYRRAYDYLRSSIAVWRAGRTIEDAMRDVPRVPPSIQPQLFNYNYAHGVGLGSSDYPHVNPMRPAIDDVLKVNQVLAIECYFAEENHPLCVKLEEQIIVRDGEPELLGPAMPFDERLIR